MTDDFERWLEGELAQAYVSFGVAALPVGAPYRSRANARRSGLAGRFVSQVVVVAAVAVAGLATTTVLATAAVTRSADPVVWSEHLVNAIVVCGGQNGAGRCVNAIVRPRRKPAPGARRGDDATGQRPGAGSPAQLVPAGNPHGKPIGSPGQGHQPTAIPNGGSDAHPVGEHGKPSALPTHSPERP